MSISFNLIPLQINTPGQFVEIDNSRAVQGTPELPHKILVIGQRIAAGTVAELVPTLVPSATKAETYFGAGSIIADMIRVLKEANPYTETWAIALDDGAGTQGTKTITVTGPATADGVIYLYLGGVRVTIAVANGDVQNDIATAIDTAIKAHSDYSRFTFTSGVSTNQVTLTAKNDGTVWNAFDVRLNYNAGESLPTGVAIAIATGVTGATDPDFSDALDVIGDAWYTTLALGFNDDTNLEAVSNFLETRFGPMYMKEGLAYTAMVGDQSALTSAGNGLNHYLLCLLEIGGANGNSPTPFWQASAIAAGVCTFEAGVDPARPLQGVALTGILPPEYPDRFMRSERDTLLTDGVATHMVDDGGTTRIERMITTYQTNPGGASDASYKDSEDLRNLASIRYGLRTRIALKYPRHKLANDGTKFDPGQAIVTPSVLKAEIVSYFRELERKGRVENVDQLAKDIIVERNIDDPNRVDALIPPDLINGFRVFAAQVQFIK